MNKQLLFALAVASLPCAAQAQVSINTTGATPDASAMLDVSSTTKGLLPPRMTEAQRTAIAAPATGLIVYQSDGAAGLYCNNGTPANSLWQPLAARAQPVYGHFDSAFNQALPSNNTFANVVLSQALVASGLTLNASTVTISTPGLYRVSYSTSIHFQASGPGQAATQVYKNNAAVGRPVYVIVSQSSLISASDEGLYSLVAGDVINLKAAGFIGSSNRIYGGTLTLVKVQ